VTRAAAATILVVDDDPLVRGMLEEALAALGYGVLSAASAPAALAVIERTLPDLVLTDVHMGAMSGVELTTRLKRDVRTQLVPVVILTAVADLDSRVAALAAGADDFFAKPVDLIELRTRLAALLRLKFVTDQLERAEGVITTLGLTIEARDPYTGGHCARLAAYAITVGRALGVDEAGLRALGLAGYLHDLGKIAVPDPILLKPGPLTPTERERIKLHPVKGAELVQPLHTLAAVRPLILYHHERLDGSGYPEGLRGETVPLGARIMAAVDVYDALRTERPYKGALDHAGALECLHREVDAGWWDPQVVRVLGEVVNGR